MSSFLQLTVGLGLHTAKGCGWSNIDIHILEAWSCCWQHPIAFSALALLVGHQEEHLTFKNWVMRCWRGYLSGARCEWFAYGPADATATPSSIASLKLTFLVPAYPGCPGKEAIKWVSACLPVCLSALACCMHVMLGAAGACEATEGPQVNGLREATQWNHWLHRRLLPVNVGFCFKNIFTAAFARRFSCLMTHNDPYSIH